MPRKNLSKRRKLSRINSRKNYQSKRRNLHTKKRKKYTKRRNTKRYKRNNLKFGGRDDSESVTNVGSEFVKDVGYIQPADKKIARVADKANRYWYRQKYKITTNGGNSIIMTFNDILDSFLIIADVSGGDIQSDATGIYTKLINTYVISEADGTAWCNVIKGSLNELYRKLDANEDKTELNRFIDFINQHPV
jgi:hypothetical protein